MNDNSSYLKRVVPEHKKPKFLAWLNANLSAVDEAVQVANLLDEKFDLENALGKQLDILGDITGRKRLLNFQPSDGSSPYLQDDLYRIIIKAKIGINHWNGTIPGMIGLWDNLFPEYRIVIKDNQDMTMSVFIVGKSPSLLRELTERNYIVPKPEGVRLNYEFTYEEKAEISLYIGVHCLVEEHYVFQDTSTEDCFYSIYRYPGIADEIDMHFIFN